MKENIDLSLNNTSKMYDHDIYNFFFGIKQWRINRIQINDN